MADEITPAKLTALRQALQRDGEVRFRNGAVISQATPADLEVTYPGGETRYVNEFAHDQLRQAYEAALEGPPEPQATLFRRPKPQPSGDGSKYGDAEPF